LYISICMFDIFWVFSLIARGRARFKFGGVDKPITYRISWGLFNIIHILSSSIPSYLCLTLSDLYCEYVYFTTFMIYCRFLLEYTFCEYLDAFECIVMHFGASGVQAPKAELWKPSSDLQPTFLMTKGRNRSVCQQTGRFDYQLQGSCSSLSKPTGLSVNRPVLSPQMPLPSPRFILKWVGSWNASKHKPTGLSANRPVSTIRFFVFLTHRPVCLQTDRFTL
jgi:hypothetical protein